MHRYAVGSLYSPSRTLTAREQRLAEKHRCQLDPERPERRRSELAIEMERSAQARAARPLIALAVKEERRGEQGPVIELCVNMGSGSIGTIDLPIRLAELGAGAREAINAGLLSLKIYDWNPKIPEPRSGPGQCPSSRRRWAAPRHAAGRRNPWNTET